MATTYKFTAAAAFGAAALFSMLSFGGKAEASSVFQCEGSTAKKVVSCCQEMTRSRLPLWMVKSGKDCAQVVSCGAKSTPSTVGAALVARCYVKFYNEEPKGDGGGKRGGDRGPNSTRGAAT